MAEDNLTNIKDIRKKKAKSKSVMGSKTVVKEEFEGGSEKRSKPEKLKFGTVEKILSSWIDGDDKHLPFVFGATFKVIIPTDYGSSRIILKVDEHKKIASFVTEKEVASELSRAIDRPSMLKTDLDISHRQALEVARRWIDTRVESYPEPKAIAFSSDPEMAYARLEFDPLPESSVLWPATDFPILNAALSRITNADAFCARIGSFFFPDADRKQAIWLWGEGDGGKSFWQDVLSYLAGGRHAVADLTPSLMGGDHWKTAIVGKNLILIREAEAGFLTDPQFKSLLGDSSHMVNPKNQPIFTTTLKCFALFASNEMPIFPNESGIKNRVIVCKVAPVPEAERLDNTLLWERIKPELQSFVSYCLAVYKANGPGKIQVHDNSDVEEAMEMYDIGFNSLFDEWFQLDEENVLPAEQFNLILERQNMPRTGKHAAEFRTFLKREYGDSIKFGRFGPKDNRPRGVKGINLKKCLNHIPPNT